LGKPFRGKHEYNLVTSQNINTDKKYEAVVLGVAHKEFLEINLKEFMTPTAVLYDVKGILPLKLVDGRL